MVLRRRSLTAKTTYLLATILIFAAGFHPVSSSEQIPEYQIKAGFLYKFLLFVEWPETAFDDSGDIVSIGILGSNPFGDAFQPVEGKSIRGRKLVIRRFKQGTRNSSLLDCQLLFISTSEKSDMRRILRALHEHPVLTVSEFDGFIELGGMINFVEKDKNVRFEINDNAARGSGITIRSVMKRVATRIIGEADELDDKP